MTIDNVIYNPTGTSPGSFVLGFGDYEDIRIDSNMDGKIDFWKIRKANLQVGVRYKMGHVEFIDIKKYSKGRVDEALLVPQKGGFKVAKRTSWIPRSMNGTADSSCETAKEDIIKQLNTFSKDISKGSLARNAETYFDNNCTSESNADSFMKVLESFKTILNDESKPSIGNFAECLKGPEAQALLKGDKDEGKLGLEVVSAKTSLDLKKLAQGEKSSEGMFVCSANSNTGKFDATYTEGGKINLKLPADPKDMPTSEQITNLLRHELLHRVGVTDEGLTDSLVQICSRSTLDKVAVTNASSRTFSYTITSDMIKVAAFGDSATTTGANDASPAPKKASSRAPASATGGGADGVDMKSEIANAEKVVPTAEKLAQTTTDKSPEGVQNAVKDSVTTSTPVLRMANQVMGASNTPAEAADTAATSSSYRGSGGGGGGVSAASTDAPSTTTSYESSSSRSSDRSSSDSSSSDRYQAHNGRYQSGAISASNTSTDGPKVKSSSSSTGLAPGERIVEEIDLTKNRSVSTSSRSDSTPRAVTADTNNRATSGGASRVPASAVPAAPASVGGDISAPGPIGSGSTGLGGPSSGLGAPSSPTGASSATTNRRVANARGPASTASATTGTTSREELVTFLSNGDYSATKRKLQDAGFMNTLRTNKVTIVDLYGNSFGASRGEVIFLDQGDKFVRQK